MEMRDNDVLEDFKKMLMVVFYESLSLKFFLDKLFG